MIRSGAEQQARWGGGPGAAKTGRRGAFSGLWGGIWFTLTLLMLWTGPAWCGTEVPLDGRLALDYARQLLSEGDIKGAQAELKRFLFFCPEEDQAGEARQLLATLEAGSGTGAEATEAGKSDGPSGGGRVVSAAVRFYQDHLRTFRRPGASCPSYPSCSVYTLEAVEKHGAFLGMFIFIDRFWREVTTAGKPPHVLSDGRKLHFDPLENNDYWLEGEKGSGK